MILLPPARVSERIATNTTGSAYRDALTANHNPRISAFSYLTADARIPGRNSVTSYTLPVRKVTRQETMLKLGPKHFPRRGLFRAFELVARALTMHNDPAALPGAVLRDLFPCIRSRHVESRSLVVTVVQHVEEPKDQARRTSTAEERMRGNSFSP